MSDDFGSIPIQPAQQKAPSPPRVEKPQPKRPVKKQKQKTPSRFPIYFFPVIFLAFLVVGYLIAGFWGIPRYLHTSLPELFRQQTGLTLQLGRVEFSPFSFDLKVSDITVLKDEGAPETLLSLNSVAANIAPLPLFKGELITTDLLLDSFEINLNRNSEGDYNFYVASKDGRKASPATFFDISALPFRFSLNNISLSNGRITFQDKPKNTIHIVEQIQLTLPNLSNFSFQAKEYIRPSFSAVINGSPIQLTGQAALTGNSKDSDAGLKTELSCNFNAIDLKRYFDYLPFNLPFNITNGQAEGTLKLTFAQSGNDDMLSVDFSMDAADMALTSADDSFRLQVPAAKFEGAIQPLTGNMQLRNLELREPTTHIADNFSFAHFKALASLATAKDGAAGQGGKGPEVKIALFLVDSGKVILTGAAPGKEKSRWETVQFTMKNYTNAATVSDPAKQATFRLTGEQSKTRATVNWQGRIDEHLLPTGDLLLTNIDAADVFPLLGLNNINARTGTAEVQAFLSFKDYPNLDLNSRISVSEGVITFKDLSLAHNKTVWYSAPVTKFAGFSKDGKKLSLGSVYLKNSAISLYTDSLPDIARKLSAEKGSTLIDALEFSGSLTLANSASKLPPLKFTDVSLQAINLARLESSSERDNLTFTARLGKTGEIQGKGKVRLTSFITTLSTGFSGIDGSLVLPWFGNSPLLTDASVLLAGKGTFSFPYVSYNGELLLQDGKLARKEKPYFSWKEIQFKELRYNSEPLHFGAGLCAITEPKLSWTFETDGPSPAAALSNFFTSHFQRRNTAPADAKKMPVLELQKLNIASGAIQLKDNRLSPSWKSEIGGLTGTFEKITSDPNGQAAPFELRGKFEEMVFALNGAIHLFDLKKQGHAELTLNDFPLASFQEMLKKRFSLDAGRGTVSALVKTSWANGMISRKGDLTIANVVPLSAKADSALALALLGDTEGRFALSVNTEQAMATPASPLLTDGLAAFNKLILKSAVSPLLVATGDFSHLAGEEYVEFLPGQILLSDQGQQSLTHFGNLLTAHPNIGLTVTGGADATIDSEAMKKDLEKAEEQRVAEENERRSGALQKAIEEYQLQAAEKNKAKGNSGQIVKQEIPKELYRRYAPITAEKVVIDKSMLQNLAKERARVIADLLTDRLQLAPERISPSKKTAVTSGKDAPGNRALLTVGTFAMP